MKRYLKVFLVEFVAAPEKWIFVLFVMAPWISWLAETPPVIQFFPNKSFRLRIVYWLVATPILAISLGETNAQLFFDGHENRTVAPTGAAKNLQWDQQHPIGYLVEPEQSGSPCVVRLYGRNGVWELQGPGILVRESCNF